MTIGRAALLLVSLLGAGTFAGCPKELRLGVDGPDRYMPVSADSTWLYDLEVTMLLGGGKVTAKGTVARRALGPRLRGGETLHPHALAVTLPDDATSAGAFVVPVLGLVSEVDYRITESGVWEVGARRRGDSDIKPFGTPRQIVPWPLDEGRGFEVRADDARLICLSRGREQISLLPKTFDDAIRFDCEGHVRGPEVFNAPELAVSLSYWLAPGAGVLKVDSLIAGSSNVRGEPIRLFLSTRHVLRELIPTVTPTTP